MTAPEILGVLKRTPVLAELEQSDLEVLSRATRLVHLGTRQLLWSVGQPAANLGIVLAGRLKLTRQESGRELIIEVVGPGDVVGEVALSLRRSYQFDVFCLRRARLLLVPTSVLNAQLRKRPKACVALAFDLAIQVLNLSRRVESLSAGNVEHRLARVLLNLVDRFGEPFPGGMLVPLRLRREDLASLAATTIESASRQISAWKHLGILVPQPSGYLVRDVVALRRIVSSD